MPPWEWLPSAYERRWARCGWPPVQHLTPRPENLLLIAGALAVLLTRIVYLPISLEDIDSMNFDLGVHDFNPVEHRPHPPGFPVFIALAKLVHPFFDNHAAGLGAVSAICSALVFPLVYVLAQYLIGRSGALLATALLIFNPLFWLNSVRPMSDVTGFAAVLAALCLLVYGGSQQSTHSRSLALWIAGAVMAGLAIGVRIQNALMLLPILILGSLTRRHFLRPTAASLAVSCALWIVPTIIESGGVTPFWSQLRLLLSVAWPSEPLVSALTWQRAGQSAADVLILPWGEVWMACGVLLSAAAGVILMWCDPQRRKHLGVLLVLFAPYAVYHSLLQETTTLRYAISTLPLMVIPAAFAISRAVRDRDSLVVAVTAAIVAVCATVTAPKLAAYSDSPSPPAQAIQHLAQLALKEDLVVSGDHVFERYLPQLAPVAQVIPPKAREEWRAVNRYWVAGNRRPVWYLTDTVRSVLSLADPKSQTRANVWEWPETLRIIQKGVRPAHVELIRLDPPRWFVESGFLLTPDAGPPDRVAKENHLLFVSKDIESDRVLVSGATTTPTVVSVFAGHNVRQDWAVSEHFSVQTIVPTDSRTSYTPVRFEANVPLLLTDVSVVGAREDVVRPTSGFYKPERDEENKEYRWIAPSAEVLVSRSGVPVWVTLRGYVHIEHVKLPVTVEAQVDGRWAGRYELRDASFTITIYLAATNSRASLVTLSTSQSFVPDKVEGNGDTRALALQIYSLEVDSRRPTD
jgi:Dolichyl-phosphate-mannose-protein mannosyltransferase